MFVIAAVAAVVIGTTTAYFSNTETSTGNTFTAGAIDLEVDSTAYYNGHVCENGQWQCESWADSIVSFNQGTKKNGGPVPPERSDPTKALGPAENNDTYNFVSLGLGLAGEIVLKFDNYILNGEGDDLEIIETSFGSPSCAAYPERARVFVSQDGDNWDQLGEVCVDGSLDFSNGSQNLPWAKYVKLEDITNPNDFGSGDVDGYDLDGVRAIHCNTEPNLVNKPCDGSWDLTNLEEEKFFNFTDLKPGDSGKNIISLHLADNDGWACMYLDNIEDDDNGLVEPEADGGDTTAGEGQGEVSENMDVFMWLDENQDDLYNPNEPVLVEAKTFAHAFESNSAIQYPIIALADSLNGRLLTASSTAYVGFTWCIGDLEVDEQTANINCEIPGIDNITQTDSLSADLIFYTEQQRNNLDFTCKSLKY